MILETGGDSRYPGKKIRGSQNRENIPGIVHGSGEHNEHSFHLIHPFSCIPGCPKLKTVKGGAAVTNIKDGAFSSCKVLKTFPAMGKLQKIGANAFKGDKALPKFTLAKSVNSIGKNTFNGCAGLKTITVKAEKLTSKNVGAGAFKGINKKATFSCPKKQLKAYKKLFVKKGAPKTCKFK